MNQPPFEEDSTVGIIDRGLVLALMSGKIFFRDTYKNDKNKTVFLYSSKEAREIIDAWQMGKPIVRDIRDVLQAEVAFNSIVHGG